MFAHAVCICSAIPCIYTVMAELYQQTLVTEKEVRRMKEVVCIYPYTTARLVPIQCTKPLAVATRAVSVLDKFGYKVEARKLAGW